MYSIVFKGWNEGFKKITFTNFLREKAALSPTQSKLYFDAILDGITIRVECASKEIMLAIHKDAAAIGAICEISEDSFAKI